MTTIKFQGMLDTMPKSRIPEVQELIQEIHTKIKKGSIPPNGNFFVFYRSYLSSVSGEIKNKLSRGYRELFEKANAVSICNVQQHNPFEHPNTGIEREIERIELGWKAVQAKKEYLLGLLNGFKKMLVPIIETDLKGDDKETIKRIHDIPYSEVRDDKGYLFRGPYIFGITGSLTFNKFDIDKAFSSTIDEMVIYGEKELLQEYIPIIRKVYEITMRIRKLKETEWKGVHLQKGEYKKWKIDMHNATGHIHCGITSVYTLKSIERMKLTYPDIYSRVI
jgi:hypothetical protein